MRVRKKPIVVEAHQWWKNGDHPDDRVGEDVDAGNGQGYTRVEGAVVRFYRHPDVPDDAVHADLPGTRRPQCMHVMHDHGWIDTMEGGHTVCPGDWIITGVHGERYPCESAVFDASYESIDDDG